MLAPAVLRLGLAGRLEMKLTLQVLDACAHLVGAHRRAVAVGWGFAVRDRFAGLDRFEGFLESAPLGQHGLAVHAFFILRH